MKKFNRINIRFKTFVHTFHKYTNNIKKKSKPFFFFLKKLVYLVYSDFKPIGIQVWNRVYILKISQRFIEINLNICLIKHGVR